MRRALNMLRSSPHYRREAFDEGLDAAGFVVTRALDNPHPGDVLLIWNRYGVGDSLAQRFEAAGATVLVAENCPLGNSWRAGVWYSLARTLPAVVGGKFAEGGSGRWDAWRVPLAPWREPLHGEAGEVVVFAQRSIGNPLTASPPGWAERVAPRLRARIRQHPGTRTDIVPLEVDLREARGAVTWASSAALHALRLGVPVWHEHPAFVGAPAARALEAFCGTESANRDDEARLGMFRRLAWCMWELDEVRSGEALRWVCRAS